MLCKIGWHNWIYSDKKEWIFGKFRFNKKFYSKRTCKRCGEIQVLEDVTIDNDYVVYEKEWVTIK